MQQNLETTIPIPQQLFVGALEGAPNCTLDANTYDIWPKLMVMVLMHGAQHFVMDNREFRLDAGSIKKPTPSIVVINVARYAKLRFINDSDAPLKKVMISAPRPWVEQVLLSEDREQTELRQFLSEHLAVFRAQPGEQILAIAEHILNPPKHLDGDVSKLYRKARALELMTEVCSALTDRNSKDKAATRHRLQSEKVRDYILQRLNQELTIDAIAKSAGASVSSVQRHFKSIFGVSVFEFIRAERLNGANEALHTRGISVAEAAHLAGYADAAQFSTAFKRAFGVSPGVRRN